MSVQSLSSGPGKKLSQSHSRPVRNRTPIRVTTGKVRTEKAMPDFSHSLPMLLMRGREAVMRLFRSSLRDHDVTEQQWRVLRALAHAGDCEVTELARITFLHAPSISRILRDLLGRGLVERTSGATDRRRGIVSISQSGRELIDAVAPESEAGYAQIRQRFGAKRLRALQSMLRELEAVLDKSESAANRK